MKSKINRTIAITSLIILVTAAFALAVSEDQPNPNDRRARYGQGQGAAGFRAGRGGQQGRFQGGPGQGRGGYGPGRGMMGGPGRGMGLGMGQEILPEMIKRKLNLTEEQTKKLEDAQTANSKKTQELMKQHQQLRQKLETAVDKGDKEAVTKIANELGTNIGQSALLKVSAQDSLKEILNEEQLKVLEDFKKQRAEMREKMRERMQSGEGRGDRFRGRRGQDQDSLGRRGPGRQDQDSGRRRGRARQNQD